jgi:membrane-associated PAP2 superfamily phosphatase
MAADAGDQPMNSYDLAWLRTTAWLLGLGFALEALFSAAPWIDLWASGLFYDGSGFPLGHAPATVLLRDAYQLIFIAMCVCAVVGLVGALACPAGRRASWRLWAFVVSLMALGPGLLTNVILKDHWGRARPVQIVQFGGHAAFTGPFVMTDQCASNCSFVSGEGSTAAAVAAALVALFWRALPGDASRAAAVAALAAWLGGAAFFRMARGGHFLSDTLFAFIFMALVAVALYRILGLRDAGAGVGPRAMAADLALDLRRAFAWARGLLGRTGARG